MQSPSPGHDLGSQTQAHLPGTGSPCPLLCPAPAPAQPSHGPLAAPGVLRDREELPGRSRGPAQGCVQASGGEEGSPSRRSSPRVPPQPAAPKPSTQASPHISVHLGNPVASLLSFPVKFLLTHPTPPEHALGEASPDRRGWGAAPRGCGQGARGKGAGASSGPEAPVTSRLLTASVPSTPPETPSPVWSLLLCSSPAKTPGPFPC